MSQVSDHIRHSLPMLFIAFTLMMLTPFLVFIHYQGYELWAPEIAICILGLSSVGCVLGALAGLGGRPMAAASFGVLFLFFVDLQFDWIAWWGNRVYFVALVGLAIGWVLYRNLGLIVTVVMTTMMVSTLFLPDGDDEYARADRPLAGGPNAELPVVLHLILDEHIGVEGIQLEAPTGPNLKAHIEAFYERYGFRLFGKAVSQYFNTSQSIAHVFNFASSHEKSLVERDRSGQFEFKLTANKYFQLLNDSGYGIRVYQTSYMDICPDGLPSLELCRTQRMDDISVLNESTLPILDKVQVIAGLYTSRSTVLGKLIEFFSDKYEGSASRNTGFDDWAPRHSVVSSLSGLPVLEQVRHDLSRAQGGEAFIAHVMLPHYPYVYDRTCGLIAPREWLDRFSTGLGAASKLLRNERYHHQIGCVYKSLSAIFDEVKRLQREGGAVAIVHGDHGSRIVDVAHPGAGEGLLPLTDYVPSYSTLLAISHPDLPAGYDLTSLTIQEWLARFLQSHFEDLPADGGGGKDRPLVYRKITIDGVSEFQKVQMVDFLGGEPRN